MSAQTPTMNIDEPPESLDLSVEQLLHFRRLFDDIKQMLFWGNLYGSRDMAEEIALDPGAGPLCVHAQRYVDAVDSEQHPKPKGILDRTLVVIEQNIDEADKRSREANPEDTRQRLMRLLTQSAAVLLKDARYSPRRGAQFR